MLLSAEPSPKTYHLRVKLKFQEWPTPPAGPFISLSFLTITVLTLRPLPFCLRHTGLHPEAAQHASSTLLQAMFSEVSLITLKLNYCLLFQPPGSTALTIIWHFGVICSNYHPSITRMDCFVLFFFFFHRTPQSTRHYLIRMQTLFVKKAARGTVVLLWAKNSKDTKQDNF